MGLFGGAIQEKADALPNGLFAVRAANDPFAAVVSWLFAAVACLPSPKLDKAETLTLRFELPQLAVVAWLPPPSAGVLRGLWSVPDRGAGAGSYAAPVLVDELLLDLVGLRTFMLRGRAAG